MPRRKEYLPIDKFPEYKVYHETFDKKRLDSQILNGGNKYVSFHTVLWDKTNIEAELRIITGENSEQPGMYKVGSQWQDCKLQVVKLKLQDIRARFDTYCTNQKNLGFKIPTDWPKELLEERLIFEAKYDVLQEEIKELKKRLEKYTEEKQVETNRLMLSLGPCAGVSHVGRNGVLDELDYQSVGYVGNVLCITDKASPYYGLSVMDYREKIAAPWVAAYRQIDRWAGDKFKRMEYTKNKTLNSVMLDKMWIEEKQRRLAAHPEWNDLFKLQLPGKPPMPDFPKDCINHFEQKVEIEEGE